MSLTTEIEKTKRGLSLEKRCWLRNLIYHPPNGMVITISTNYEWLPSGCSSCNVFGHNLTRHYEEEKHK